MSDQAFTFYEYAEHGMTKREYFAAMALQGLLASGSVDSGAGRAAVDSMPEIAVRSADRLIEAIERSK